MEPCGAGPGGAEPHHGSESDARRAEHCCLITPDAAALLARVESIERQVDMALQSHVEVAIEQGRDVVRDDEAVRLDNVAGQLASFAAAFRVPAVAARRERYITAVALTDLQAQIMAGGSMASSCGDEPDDEDVTVERVDALESELKRLVVSTSNSAPTQDIEHAFIVVEWRFFDRFMRCEARVAQGAEEHCEKKEKIRLDVVLV